MRTLHLEVLPADGIGPEVIRSGRRVLESLAQSDGGLQLDFQEFDWGSER